MFANYDALDTLYSGRGSDVLRYRSNQDNHHVIIKQLRPEAQNQAARARLAFEYKILCTLRDAQVPGIPQKTSWIERGSNCGIAMEDIGGVSLTRILDGGAMPLKEVLDVGVRICTTLAAIHHARVMHKDINPNNVVYNRQTGEVQIIDFGISSQLALEPQSAGALSSIEGTPAFVPPEQTGRMNRMADYRADIYAVGATLYALLSGHPPFDHADLAQLVYQIVTTDPAPLGDVPPMVAHIIARMMAKSPEDRYQSAAGAAADLLQCRTLLAQGDIPPFALAQHDTNEQFSIPPHLYGRESEATRLLAIYHKAVSQRHQCIVLRGPSGIGKSALVNHVHRAIVEHHGLYAAGKCDQGRRSIPLFALAQSIDMLVRCILVDSASVESWRRRVQHALGRSGKALFPFIPALELLLGEQPNVPELGYQETENRLHYLLQSLLRAFSAKQPLVLFLDDLQWADGATLKFLSALAQEVHGAGILLICAYRDQEVPQGHPLLATLEALSKSTMPMHAMDMGPMSAEAIAHLVADACHVGVPEAQALAPLLLQKTAGNPFFLRAFLKHLWEHSIVHYAPTRGAFTWDLEAVRRVAVSDNAVAFMTQKLQALAVPEQKALTVASTLGNDFALHELMATLNWPRAQLLQALQPALGQGLVLAMDSMGREHAQTIVRHLLSNARDAVLEGNGPRQITVQSSGDAVSVQLRVQDTGVGMSDATQQHIFQPFFTTKGAGGTGLSLGHARKLSQAYSGDLTFESQAGEGSTFCLKMPRLRHQSNDT